MNIFEILSILYEQYVKSFINPVIGLENALASCKYQNFFVSLWRKWISVPTYPMLNRQKGKLTNKR